MQPACYCCSPGADTKIEAVLDLNGVAPSESDVCGVEFGVNALLHLSLCQQLTADQHLHVAARASGLRQQLATVAERQPQPLAAYAT